MASDADTQVVEKLPEGGAVWRA